MDCFSKLFLYLKTINHNGHYSLGFFDLFQVFIEIDGLNNKQDPFHLVQLTT